jgi:hypothetical protein
VREGTKFAISCTTRLCFHVLDGDFPVLYKQNSDVCFVCSLTPMTSAALLAIIPSSPITI